MAGGGFPGAGLLPAIGLGRVIGFVRLLGFLVVGGELFVAGQAAVSVGQFFADAIDRFADGAGEAVDDILRRVLFEVGDGLGAEKLEDLAGFVIFVEEHEELFFGGDRGAAEREFSWGPALRGGFLL